MRARYTGWTAAVLGAALFACVLVACKPPAAPPATLSVGTLLGNTEVAGYARAAAPRDFQFPADHGPHPAYRSEWWYFTGNLDGAGGRRFGYELSLFRFALSPQPPQRASAWATKQAYMGHFAITDVAGRRFHFAERLARGALGLAGAQAAPLRVWVEDWSVTASAHGGHPWRLHARTADAELALELEPRKPVVLHGERGLSRKSAAPGNASYYYSLPRMASRGTLTVGGESFTVHGESWLDREWSTSALAPDQVGWDWFGLQLADGRELMYYQLRRRDGGADAYSGGTLIERDGHATRLRHEDVELAVLSEWTSPRGGRYPARWRLVVKPAGLDLEITPMLADQELAVSIRYWEGAVDVRGSADGRAVHGRGYAELTGYANARDAAR